MYPHQWGKHGVNITNNISWKYPITNVSMLSHCYPITTRWCPRSRTLSWWTQLQFHYGFCWWYKSIVHGLISPIYYWGGTNLCPISIIFHHHAISLSHENIPWISIMVIPSLSHHYSNILLSINYYPISPSHLISHEYEYIYIWIYHFIIPSLSHLNSIPSPFYFTIPFWCLKQCQS